VTVSGLLTVAYLLAAVLFILSLGGLANQETARRGNLFGILGMVLATVATLLHPQVAVLSQMAVGYPIILGSLVVGGAVGVVLALRVQMTSMPQLVAALHSFVGLGAVLVGYSTWLHPATHASPIEGVIHGVEIALDVVIGAITFTGSVVAWLKLDGRVSGAPLLLPGRHALNLLVLGLVVASCGLALVDPARGVLWLSVAAVLSGLLGAHLVLAIGGADMPVVVSLLNSYSGWTAAAAGFMLENDLLIVTGALVGSSGAILSVIMCRAMNRSIWNVVFGGFGGAPVSGGRVVEGSTTEVDTDALVALLRSSRSVIIVPGYGMAVAQAQAAVRQFTRVMKDRGTEVRFAIHPVAGRLPGHMNVLLAEAGVPYDQVLELDEINDDFPSTDVVLVIGANDIVNPSALDDPQSPIAGMPVLHAWEAGTCVVLKRGKGAGYAGIENPLFVRPNTRMYYGDARSSMDKLNAALAG
jgi:NAD(P) transhydrogenase subunit beta